MGKIIIILFCMLISCQNSSKEKKEFLIRNQHGTFNLKDDLSNFSEKMNDKDTLIMKFNLSMEWSFRTEKMIFIKDKSKTYLKVIARKKIMGLDSVSNRLKLPLIEYIYSQDSLSIESLITKNIYRTIKKEEFTTKELVKISYKKSFINLYTYGLGDKGAFLKDYFKTMKYIYPNEKDYFPVEIEE